MDDETKASNEIALAHLRENWERHQWELRRMRRRSWLKAVLGLVVGVAAGMVIGRLPTVAVLPVMLVLFAWGFAVTVVGRPGHCQVCGKRTFTVLPRNGYTRRAWWDPRWPSRDTVAWACNEHLMHVIVLLVQERDS